MSKRIYGLDLLRIILMLGVVTLHINLFSKEGELNLCAYNEFDSPLSYYSVLLIEFMAICAVNGFAILSGYVGYNAKYRMQRIIPLYFTVWFFNAAAAIIVHLTGVDSFRFMAPESVVEHLFPICGGAQWFFVAYTGVFLLMPLINSAVRNTDEKQLIVSVTAAVLLISCVGIFAEKDVFSLTLSGRSSGRWLW